MRYQDISIKWKILFIVILGPIVIAVIMAWQRTNDIEESYRKALIEKSGW